MITTLCSKDNMQISTNDKNIGYFVLPQINGDRKGMMININFILNEYSRW